jgi:hypothetical protein
MPGFKRFMRIFEISLTRYGFNKLGIELVGLFRDNLKLLAERVDQGGRGGVGTMKGSRVEVKWFG